MHHGINRPASLIRKVNMPVNYKLINVNDVTILVSLNLLFPLLHMNEKDGNSFSIKYIVYCNNYTSFLLPEPSAVQPVSADKCGSLTAGIIFRGSWLFYITCLLYLFISKRLRRSKY